ncbi:MAG: glycosyltransferase family 4 protein [Candidatus Andersenbacteria bacterium]
MKLLFLSGHYPPNTTGGGEISTHLIARGLVQAGHEVHVVCEGERKEEQELDGVHITRIPLGLTAKPLFEQRASKAIATKLVKEIELSNYDTIHAHDFRSALVVSEIDHPRKVVTVRDYAQIAGDTNHFLASGEIPTDPFSKKTIWQSHRIQEASFPRNILRFWQYAYNIGYRREAFKEIKNHIYISHAQLDEISKFQDLTHHLTSVIYNPIAPEYLSEPIKEGEAAQVLYIGRVEDYKGVRVLLSIWANVIKAVPQAHLVIVGKGAQKEAYERYVAARGLQYSVTFEDAIAHRQIMQTYDKASIVIAPHIWIEPFGRTVIEGMSRGKITISTMRGGPAEIIQDGATGFLCEPGVPESLERALIHALTLDRYARRDIQRSAHEWIASNLSISKIASQYENFYQQLR